MTSADALTALDTTRASILADLDAFGPEQRTFSPGPEAWSPEQVAEHLATVERGILEAIQQSGEAHLGTPSQTAVESLIGFMNTDQRSKTPPFLQPTGQPFEDSRQALEAVGARWHELATARADALRDRAVFAHPVAGPMTFIDTVRFVEAHAGHHRRQLERIRASPGFPV